MAIVMHPVSYQDGETHLHGFFVLDEAQSDKRPGILIIHGGGGLDDHAKGRARRFAQLGYVVLAADMYGEGVQGDRDRVMAALQALRSDTARLVTRARAGIAVLEQHPQCNGRLAAIGYCFGGMTVLELARHGVALDGVVSVHGSLQTSAPAQPAAIKARILVCHGALDPHVPVPQVTAFIEEMNNAGPDWQLIAYGGAVHGFSHDTAPASTIPGVAYDARTDARSSLAIQNFLTELFA